MVRRQYNYLNLLVNRLNKRLQRLVIYYRAGGSIDYVMAQAKGILEEYFTQLIAYTRRSHVQRDLHRRKNIKDLGYAETQELRADIENKLEDFKGILLDVR